MVVSWEVGQRRETRGVVVDLCSACAGLQPHFFCDNFAALQVNTVNLDRGMFSHSSVLCFRCSGEAHVARTRYATFIPPDLASKIPLSEGLLQTNPDLAKALEAVEAARAGGARADIVERVESILFVKGDAAALLDQLLSWADLTEADRQAAAQATFEIWQSLDCPQKPSAPIQPGMPGWLTPTGEPSVRRAIDYKVLAVALSIVGFIVAIIIIFD